MEWLRLDTGLPEHPKVVALSEELKIGVDAALGMVVKLFCWTAKTREDGDLAGCTPTAIAYGARLPGKPSKVIAGLVAAGWLDQDADGGLVVHGWSERSGVGAKVNHRERQRLSRERWKARVEAESEALSSAAPDASAAPERGAGAAETDVSVRAEAADGDSDHARSVRARGPQADGVRTDVRTYGRTDVKSIPPTCSASVREAKADGADAPRRRAAPKPPGFVDFAALSDAELHAIRAEAAKGAERDDRERRRYYAASHELARRLGPEGPSGAPGGAAEARDAAGADDSAEARGGLTAPQGGRTREAVGATESALAAVEGA